MPRGLMGATPDELTAGLLAYRKPEPDYIGQVAQRVRALGGLLSPETWRQALATMPDPRTAMGRAEALRILGGQQSLFDMALDASNPINAVGGLLGTFKGMNANLSDVEREMLAKAFAMEQQGLGREAIRQATNPPGGSGGWFRAPWDQKWRIEIDDSASGFIPQAAEKLQTQGAGPVSYGEGLDAWYSHPGFREAYPDALRDNANLYKSHREVAASQFPTGGIAVTGTTDLDKSRSAVLHELDHEAQVREGFAYGGSPSGVASQLLDDAKGLRNRARSLLDAGEVNRPQALALEQQARRVEDLAKIAEFAPDNIYRRLAGEAQSRLVEARRDLSSWVRSLVDPIEQMDTMLRQEGISGGINDLIVRY